MKKTILPMLSAALLMACAESGTINSGTGANWVADNKLSVGILSGQEHYQNGVQLLNQSGNLRSKIYFARSAFEKSAALKVDDPHPFLMAGYTNFLLSDFTQAYNNFLSAAILTDESDAWFLSSLSALKSGHELVAQAAYNKGISVKPGKSMELSNYMRELYEGSMDRPVFTRISTLSQNDDFVCEDVDDIAFEDSEICSSNVQIEFFIVERTSESSSLIGKDIMSGLSVKASGSILDYGRALEWDETGLMTDKSANLKNDLTIDLSSITYNLSVATDGGSTGYVSSNPILKTRLGETSILKAGESLVLIDLASDGGEIEEEMGVTISTELSQFTNKNATFSVSMELNEFFEPYLSNGAMHLQSDQAEVKSFGTVPYNTGFLVGSIEIEQFDQTSAGQSGVRNIPVFGNLFGKRGTLSKRRELALLATVRPPEVIQYNIQINEMRILKALGVSVPEFARRNPILHKAPTLDSIVMSLELMGQ